MSNEEKINEGLAEIHEDVISKLPRRTGRTLQVISDVRLLISDILAKHVGAKGVVPSNKIPSVIREVKGLHSKLYTNIQREVRMMVSETSESVSISLASLLVSVFGISTLAGIVGIEASKVLTEEALFGALIGSGIFAFIQSIVVSIFNQKGESDRRTLTQRLRILARLLLKEMEDTLRTSISNGEDTTSILRKLDRVVNSNKSRVKKIVDTESLVTVRQSVAKFAETSGMVAGLKITDFPHGHAHGNDHAHIHHKCFIYAQTDDHGMGKGVYPVTTRKIRNPHPQCRSILTFVLKPEFEEV